ncbi:MAG: hypothetical protein PQJ46_06695, partial [Spirochaetales bacterium]|nr:hypothetical protein [Spirochaetales bacterium]
MLFTTGNIITILIVLIILILYRQLDRNNRSLDKVRRYSEKVTSEIEAFVDQKTQDMKNLAIEIDVHQKTGKALLKRITDIEEGFSSKAAEVDEINEKIIEYDKALNELAGMTGKVDENLRRLHQESEFVDKVGKRLKDTKNKLFQLEKDIPKLNEDFAALNQKEFELLKAEMFSEVERQADSVKDDIASGEQRVEDFINHLDSLEQRRDDAAEKVISDIEAASERALGEAEDKFIGYKNEFAESMNEITAAADGKRMELQEYMQQSEAGYRTHIDEVESILDKHFTAFKDSVTSLEAEYQQSLENSAVKAKSLEDDVYSTLKEYIEERSRDTRKQINNVFEELKKEALVYRTEIDNSVNSSKDEIIVWRESFSKDFEESTLNIRSEMAGSLEELKSSYNSFRNEIDSSMENSRQELYGWKEGFSQEIESGKTQASLNMEEALAGLKESYLAYCEELNASMTDSHQKLGNWREEFFKDIETGKSEAARKMEESLEDLKNSYDIYRTEIDSSMQESRFDLDKWKDGFIQDIDNKSESVKAYIDNAFEDIKSGYQETQNAMDSSLNESRLALGNWQTGFKEQLDGKHDDISVKIEAVEKELSEKLDAIVPKTEGLLKDIDNESRLLVENTKGDISRRVENMISTVNDKEARLSEFEESLAYKITRVEEITNDINLLEDNLKQMVEKAVNEVNSSFDSISSNMEEQWKKTQDSLQRDISSSKTEMSQLESELDSLKSRAYDNVSEKLQVFETDFFDDLKEKSNKMETRLIDWQGSVDKKLERISEESSQARSELETSYNDQLNQRLSELTEKTAEDFTHYEQYINGYEDGLNKKLESINQAIEALKGGLDSKLVETNASLDTYLNDQIESTRGNINDMLTKYVRDSEALLNEAEASSAADNEKMKQQVELQVKELELWQNRLKQQFTE